MKKYKVCVYAISKNEEKFVDRWMECMSEADLIIVSDTGSTDRTADKLRERGAQVFEETTDPWRFDVARNKAMDHIPKDIDICVSTDLDEVFEPGWRDKLDAAWDPAYTRAEYLFTWSYHPDGTPSKQFPMIKIHRRHGFNWIHPVHEVLEYTGEDEDRTVFIKGLVLNHYPDASKSRSGYLSLLELSAKENPEDDRTAFWLGREYMYHAKYDLCIETLKRHLLLPSAKWAEERSASMRFIAAAYEKKGNLYEAKSWLFRAIAQCPGVREPYIQLAKLGCAEANWVLTYAMVKNALKIKQSSGSYLVEPESWGPALYELGMISAYYLGLYEESRIYAAEMLKMKNCGERLKSKLKLFESIITQSTGKKDETHEL